MLWKLGVASRKGLLTQTWSRSMTPDCWVASCQWILAQGPDRLPYLEMELIDLHSVIHGGKNIPPELFAQMMQVSSALIHMDNVGLPPSRLWRREHVICKQRWKEGNHNLSSRTGFMNFSGPPLPKSLQTLWSSINRCIYHPCHPSFGLVRRSVSPIGHHNRSHGLIGLWRRPRSCTVKPQVQLGVDGRKGERSIFPRFVVHQDDTQTKLNILPCMPAFSPNKPNAGIYGRSILVQQPIKFYNPCHTVDSYFSENDPSHPTLCNEIWDAIRNAPPSLNKEQQHPTSLPTSSQTQPSPQSPAHNRDMRTIQGTHQLVVRSRILHPMYTHYVTDQFLKILGIQTGIFSTFQNG